MDFNSKEERDKRYRQVNRDELQSDIKRLGDKAVDMGENYVGGVLLMLSGIMSFDYSTEAEFAIMCAGFAEILIKQLKNVNPDLDIGSSFITKN